MNYLDEVEGLTLEGILAAIVLAIFVSILVIIEKVDFDSSGKEYRTLKKNPIEGRLTVPPSWWHDHVNADVIIRMKLFAIGGLLILIIQYFTVVQFSLIDPIVFFLFVTLPIASVQLILWVNVRISNKDHEALAEDVSQLPLWAQKRLANRKTRKIREIFTGAVFTCLFLFILTDVIGSIPSFAIVLFQLVFFSVFSWLKVEEDFILSEEEIEDGVVE